MLFENNSDRTTIIFEERFLICLIFGSLLLFVIFMFDVHWQNFYDKKTKLYIDLKLRVLWS